MGRNFLAPDPKLLVGPFSPFGPGGKFWAFSPRRNVPGVVAFKKKKELGVKTPKTRWDGMQGGWGPLGEDGGKMGKTKVFLGNGPVHLV